MANIRKIYKSDAFEAIHTSASALHKIGSIDEVAMRRFDAAALKKTDQQNLLTPQPKELKKALALSAKQARALVAAFEVKVHMRESEHPSRRMTHKTQYASSNL